MQAQEVAYKLVQGIQNALIENPPDGVDSAYAEAWFQNNFASVQALFTKTLAPLLQPLGERLDQENKLKWHMQSVDSIRSWAAKSSREEQEWLVSSVLAHRPDLTDAAQAIASEHGLDFDALRTTSRTVYRMVPAVSEDRLVIYEADGLTELPEVLGREDFVGFAKAAYWSDDATAQVLLELTATWFARSLTVGEQPVADHAERLEQLIQQTRLEGIQGDEQAEERLQIRLRLLAEAKTEAPRDRYLSLPKPDPNLAPSPRELHELLVRGDEPSTVHDRTLANFQAIAALLDKPKPGEAGTLIRYTGWGGLSVDAAKNYLPKALVPDEKAILHEYYTPTAVALDLAHLLKPRIAQLPRHQGEVLAFEPSAGIGRLLNAFSIPGFEPLSFTAIEYSLISASLLRRMRPDITVLHSSFEQWIVATAGRLDGKFGLILCNPPFGQRGAEAAIDPDTDFREKKAYVYFVRRLLRLLAEGGIAVFIIPYGFMSSKAPQFVALREKVLKEAHLVAAFRLPSNIYPGAGIVTDAIIVESRGGQTSSVLPEDQYVVDGQYFVAHPKHILGEEVGKATEESPESENDKKPFRYEVAGSYPGLPTEPELRARCTTCQVAKPAPMVPPEVRRSRQRQAELPESVAVASSLGMRVAKYLDLTAKRDLASLAQARAMHRELLDDVLSFTASNRVSELDGFLEVEGITALTSIWQSDGKIAEVLAQTPLVEQRYSGTDSIVDTATWLEHQRGPFTEFALREFRAQLSFANPDTPTLEAELVRAGFAKDNTSPPVWMHEDAYYTGLVGQRYSRAIALRADPIAASQVARLRSIMRFPNFADIDPNPRLTWMPQRLIRAWMSDVLQKQVGELTREDNLLTLVGTPYAYLESKVGEKTETAVLFGWLNMDMSLFRPPYTRLVDDEGEQESAEEALERARLLYTSTKVTHFRAWAGSEQERIDAIEAAYATVAGNFVVPTFDTAPVQIARWGRNVTLKPHQCAVVRRLVHYNGGLNAFDTGVGKTFSGIATLAIQRERGVCRRPIVVVPNTLIWKWYRDILRCLPDYRVLVVGSSRRLNRSGVWVSNPDTELEREQKWRRFQSGQYDVAIVPYSFFPTIGLRLEAWKHFAQSTPILARKVQLKAREFTEIIDRAAERQRTGKDAQPPKVSDKKASDIVGEDAWEQADDETREKLKEQVAADLLRQQLEEEKKLRAIVEKLSSLSERNRALVSEATEQWAADMATKGEGLTFEEIGIDMILVDEAQNFKNIWAVGQLEGGTPKYLGAIQSGSERGYHLAAYRHNLSQRTGSPGGTYLLSATPAKNSPIEYFTLINLVNERAWADIGVPTVEAYIDRYLYLERREVVQADMSLKEQSVVAGFRNLLELRDIVFRYSEFKTAQEVGLKIPDSKTETLLVDMDEEQAKTYYKLAARYTATLKQMGHAEGGKKLNTLRNRALSLLSRLQLVTIHPELADGPDTPELTQFTRVPFATPDLPAEEKSRRLALLEMAGVDRKDITLQNADSLYIQVLESNPEVVAEWQRQTIDLYEIAKKKWAKKRKLKTQWSFANAVTAKRFHSPKLDKCVELILQNRNCSQIVFCDNIAVHRWLVELLMQGGIPRERIAVINGDVVKDAAKRLTISDKFNGVPAVIAPDGTVEVEEIEAEFDVVIANQAAYEGIDLHRLTCIVYHLDLPWEPSTLRQRNGRAVRQGNLQSNVDIKFILARKSLDVVRFEYILGKLRWMSDLIESADNNLANPAADNELDSEQMVLFLAQDEESAKESIRELREQQERRRRSAIIKRCWEDVTSLWSRENAIKRTDDEEKRLILLEEQRQLLSRIGRVPGDIWPYNWLLFHLPRGVEITLDHDINNNTVPIIPDWTLGGQIELGRVSGTTYGWRRFGSASWNVRDQYNAGANDHELAEILASGYLPSERAEAAQFPQEDLKGQILAILENIRVTGTWEQLGLRWASAEYKRRLRKFWWPEIVQAVQDSVLDFLVPIRVDERFDLVESNDPRVTAEALADFDRDTYTAFFRYASTERTELQYTATSLTTEQWWGIRFPRGHLKPITVSYISSRMGKRVSTKPIEASAELAVVREDSESLPPYLLVHLPSGAELRAFKTEAVARFALVEIRNRQDWSAETAPYEISQKTHALLDFLTLRTDVPSREDLNPYRE